MTMCLDGTCIPQTWECDGHNDCINGTDEALDTCSKDWLYIALLLYEFISIEGGWMVMAVIQTIVISLKRRALFEDIHVGKYLNFES